jgi:hypothetical protein
MNTKTIIVSASLTAIALGILLQSACTTASAAPTESRMIEYKIIELPAQFGPGSEEMLNRLGAQGWDVCGGYGEKIILKKTK